MDISIERKMNYIEAVYGVEVAQEVSIRAFDRCSDIYDRIPSPAEFYRFSNRIPINLLEMWAETIVIELEEGHFSEWENDIVEQ